MAHKLLALLLIGFWFYLLNRAEVFQQLQTGINPLWDFDAYYHLASDTLAGRSPYQVSYMTTLGPPLVIAPFLPFSYLPLTTARSLFTILSLVCGGLSCWILAKKFTVLPRLSVTLVLMLVLLISFPGRFTLIVGQPHYLSMLLLSWIITTSNESQKGIILGLMSIIKTYFVLMGVAFLKQKSRITLLAFAIVLLVMLCLGWVIKPAFYIEFVTERLVTIVASENRATDLDYYNQSLKATLQRLDVPQLYPPMITVLGLIAVVYIFISGNVLAAVMLSIVLSPVFWQHYGVMFFPVFITLLPQVWPILKLRYLWYLSFIFWLVEFPWLHNQPMTLGFGWLASHYFISAYVLLGLTIAVQQQQSAIHPPRYTRISLSRNR